MANLIDPANLASGVTYLGVTGGQDLPTPISLVHSSLHPTTNPGTTVGYSLDDIYNLIVNNTRVTSSSHIITANGAVVSTMYSTQDIYNALINFKNNTLDPTNIKEGTTILGVEGTYYVSDLGNSCSQNSDCNTEYCDTYGGVCSDGISYQDECAQNSDCVSNICSTYTGLCSDGNLGDSCNQNSDCVSGNICDTNSSLCVEPNSVIDGNYCGENIDCSSNHCDTDNSGLCYTPKTLNAPCSTGADCNQGLYCGYDPTHSYQGCEAGVTGVDYCYDNAGCVSGHCDTYSTVRCSAGAVGDYCNQDSDCASPNTCDVGNTYQCVATGGNLGDPCTSNSDCSANGYYCGYDSSWNQVCTNGQTGVDLCDNGNECADGYCYSMDLICSDGSVGQDCYDNSECASPNTCDTVDTHQCVAPGGDAQFGDSCSQDSDCVSGLYCDTDYSNTCTDGSNIGCTDSCADNYDSSYEYDDGSCTYSAYDGCTDPSASNYDSCVEDTGGSDDGSCTYDGNLGDPCTSNDDCSANGYYCGWYNNNWDIQRCTNGQTGVDGCEDDGYGAGAECADGYCDTNDSICSDGSVDSNCGSSSECAPGNSCSDNYSQQCVVARGLYANCTSNSNCNSPYLCDTYDGYCSNGDVGDYCNQDSDCASPNTCDVGNTYQCVAPGGDLGDPCTSNDDCSANGYYCGYSDSGLSTQVCTEGVTGSDYCNNANECADGYCDLMNTTLCSDGSVGSYCSDNSDCASPNTCDVDNTQQCVAPSSSTDYWWTGAEDNNLGNVNNYVLASDGTTIPSSLPTSGDTLEINSSLVDISNYPTTGTSNVGTTTLSDEIDGGIWNGYVSVSTSGYINGGSFNGWEVANYGEIDGGTFNCTVNVINEGNSGIDGGIFNTTFINKDGAQINSLGVFNGDVILDSGYVCGGDFSNATSFTDNGARWSTISNDLSLGSYEIDANIGLSGGSIYSGTFGGTVDCSDGNGNLWDGIFNGIVMDGGCIFGGTYNGDVTEVAANTGAIGSATFTGTLTFNTVSPQTISNSDISNITVTADGVEVDDMDGNTYTGTDFVTKNGGSFVGFIDDSKIPCGQDDGQGGYGSKCTQSGYSCATDTGVMGGSYYFCTNKSDGSWCDSGSLCSSTYCDENGYSCTEGAAGDGCLNNNDCASPNVCDTDGVHQSNVCFAITGSPCSSNSDCLTNDCDIGNTNLCIDL